MAHRPPRPKPLPAEIHSDARVQIGIRVPARISDQLKAIALAENNGVSAVVRRLLTAALAAHDHEAA